ncbi:MAG: thioredoxin-disulfide reductase [Bacteroidota bacterium]|nr:thioredoxin-disulfide reductase [Bacteroidia bacterium]NBY10058.1 thioredoxin-disulfide reductase [Sphingobacteriia bacterium]
MTTPEHHACIIIGSGPAGYTAAIYAARADLKPVLYTGLTPGGQLTETTEVDNFPGYPKGVKGPELMEDLKQQAERFGTQVRFGMVTKADLQTTPKRIWIDEQTELTADTIIVSTGASAKWLGLENETRLRMNAGGVSACAVCDGFFFKGQTVAIVGAGDTACEEASYLAKLCTKVYMIVRKSEMRASKAMQNRVKSIANIEILWDSETIDILGQQTVEGIIVKNNSTQTQQTLAVTGFFVAIGHEPNTRIFKNQLEMDEQGYLKVQAGSSKTNIDGVFAVGDCADKVYRQAVTAAGSGCMGALDAERYLAAQLH